MFKLDMQFKRSRECIKGTEQESDFQKECKKRNKTDNTYFMRQWPLQFKGSFEVIMKGNTNMTSMLERSIWQTLFVKMRKL